jgi:WD40 repeat protein
MRTTSQPATIWKPGAASSSSNQIDWSPDGRRLAIITDKAVWSGDSAAMEIVDIFTPNTRPTVYTTDQTLAGTGSFVCLAWSPRNNLIASSHSDRIDAALWQVDQPDKTPTRLSDTTTAQSSPPPYMTSLCWSIDGSWLIGIDTTLKVYLWNAAATTLVQRFALPDRTKYHPEQLPHLAQFFRFTVVTSPTASTRFAATDSDVAVIYDIQQEKVLRLLGSDDPATRKTILGPGISKYYPQVNPLAWSPNGRYLAGSYMSSPQIFVWDLQNPQPRMKDGIQMPDFTFDQKSGHNGSILDLAWSPDGHYLASSSSDTTIIIWRVDAT